MESISNINQHYLRALSSDNISDKVFELAFISGDINLIRLYLAMKEKNIYNFEYEGHNDYQHIQNINPYGDDYEI